MFWQVIGECQVSHNYGRCVLENRCAEGGRYPTLDRSKECVPVGVLSLKHGASDSVLAGPLLGGSRGSRVDNSRCGTWHE